MHEEAWRVHESRCPTGTVFDLEVNVCFMLQWVIDSCAVSDWNVGRSPDSRAVSCLRDNGITTAHKARQVEETLLNFSSVHFQLKKLHGCADYSAPFHLTSRSVILEDLHGIHLIKCMCNYVICNGENLG